MGRPNYEELISYLRKQGIDANKVKQAGMDETGYDEIQTHEGGRPMYATPGRMDELATVRREWPNADVYRTVVWLASGGSLKTVPQPEEEAPKSDPEPASPPTPEEKQKEPNAGPKAKAPVKKAPAKKASK